MVTSRVGGLAVAWWLLAGCTVVGRFGEGASGSGGSGTGAGGSVSSWTGGGQGTGGGTATGQGGAASATGASSAANGSSGNGSSSSGGGGSCEPVSAAEDVDPWSVALPSAGFGGILMKNVGAHTDVFLKSPTDYIRIGARLDWGGSVVFFGLTSNPGSNVIDANDTGRELQLAVYDPARNRQGCAWNATCLENPAPCGDSITFLGWNPVQGGDECNRGANVLSHGQVGDALEVVVQPLQWNPDWERMDCANKPCSGAGLPVEVTYRLRFRFLTEHVVEIDKEITSQEGISHAPTEQEFPTLYVGNGKNSVDLTVLQNAQGEGVAINNPGNDGFFWKNFESAAPWVTWQNAQKNYGVGLGMDQGVTQFQGWRGTVPYFHNVRPKVIFGLAAGGVVRGRSYLALGSSGTVKDELDAVFAKRPAFGTVDAPGGGKPFPYTPGDSIHVAGWVLDNANVGEVAVQIDGNTVDSIPVNQARSDVCALYPMYAGCPAPGYDGSIATGGLSTCPHLLRVVATDANGNVTVLGERVIEPQ